MKYQRRQALKAGAGLAAHALLATVGMIRPVSALAAQGRAAFEARSVDAALAALGAAKPPFSTDIELNVPELNENGAVVRLGIVSRLAKTDQIIVMIDKNPNPLAAQFMIPDGTFADLQTEVKISDSSDVHVLAKAEGRFLATRKNVKVTIGGCAADDGSAQAAKTGASRIRATVKEGIADVRVRMLHPMETGQRKTASGTLIPAHYITEFTATQNGRVVLSAQFGPSISANPYLAFKFRGGAKGDRLRVSWTDTKGETRTDEAEIA